MAGGREEGGRAEALLEGEKRGRPANVAGGRELGQRAAEGGREL